MRLILATVAFFCLALRIQATEFTEKLETEIIDGRVILRGSEWISVSTRNNTLYLKSLDASGKIDCRVPYTRGNGDEEDRLQVKKLGNGKVVAWLTWKRSTREILTWKIFVVDPENCEHHEIHRELPPRRTSLGEITLLTYNDTFDVFSTETLACQPCRYDSNGGLVNATAADPRFVQNSKYGDGFIIATIKDYDDSEGYISYSRYGECKYQRRLLNSTLEQTSFRDVTNQIISSVSTSYGQIRVCSFRVCISWSTKKLTCDLFDVKDPREPKQSVLIEKGEIQFSSVQNMPDGSAFAIILDQAEEKKVGVYVKKIKADGSVDDAITLGIFERYTWNFESFVTENGEFCVVVYDGVGFETQPQRVVVKCL